MRVSMAMVPQARWMGFVNGKIPRKLGWWLGVPPIYGNPHITAMASGCLLRPLAHDSPAPGSAGAVVGPKSPHISGLFSVIGTETTPCMERVWSYLSPVVTHKLPSLQIYVVWSVIICFDAHFFSSTTIRRNLCSFGNKNIQQLGCRNHWRSSTHTLRNVVSGSWSLPSVRKPVILAYRMVYIYPYNH